MRLFKPAPLIYFGVFFFLLGFGALLSNIIILRSLQKAYARAEAYYLFPVYTQSIPVVLRNDAHGKGFFAASRNGGRRHKGIDIVASADEPIFAAKSGRVTVSMEEKGYGQYIEILHPDELRTRYAHLSRRFAKMGQWVKRGDPIGLCGKTGNASNPLMKTHLHFEIRHSMGAVNPTSGLIDPAVQIRNK